jgi:GTP-binding protein
MIFTDLPGYGYAKLSREISSQWPSFIEPYLNGRPNLALCLALIDINVPPQESDRRLLDFLNASGRTVLIVATKADRLSGNQLHNVMKTLATEFPQAQVLPFSARTGTGREEVWRQIRSATGLQS